MTAGTLLQAHVLLGRPDRCWALLQRARRRGVALIALELNIALGAAARCGELDAAVEMLEEMLSARSSRSAR